MGGLRRTSPSLAGLRRTALFNAQTTESTNQKKYYNKMKKDFYEIVGSVILPANYNIVKPEEPGPVVVVDRRRRLPPAKPWHRKLPVMDRLLEEIRAAQP